MTDLRASRRHSSSATRVRGMPGLSPKQALFVYEYLTDLNATQAAIRAGYSRRTAKQQAARLLSHADVSAELSRELERLLQPNAAASSASWTS